MVEKTSQYLVPVKIGDIVELHTSELDRGISDPPALLCKIHKIHSDEANYELVCEAGVIDRWLPQNCFQLASAHIDFPINENVKVAIRSAVTTLSEGGGQGFLKCGANCKYTKKACLCKRNNVLCNSRCHNKS